MLWMALKLWLSTSPRGIKTKNAGKATAKGAGFIGVIALATNTLQNDIKQRDQRANEKMNRIENRAVDAVAGLAKLVETFEYQRRTESAEQREATRRIESWVFTLRQEFQRSTGRGPNNVSKVTPAPIVGPWRIAGPTPRQEPREN